MHTIGSGPGPRRRPPPVLRVSGDDGPDREDLPGDDRREGNEDLDEVQRSALDHETRWAIFEVVSRTPGLNKRQVARRVGVDRSLALQHLERLEAYDLLVLLDSAREDDEVLCFHPKHAHLWEPEDTRLLYGQAPLRQVALYVTENRGATTAAIADALEAAPRTVQEHLATLRDVALVESHRFRRRVEYHPTGRLAEWADEVGDRYRRPWIHEG